MPARRGQALSVALVAALVAVSSPVMTEPTAQLRLELVDPPGGLRLVNPGSAPVTIEATIAVERLWEQAWIPVVTEFYAVSRCDGLNTPAQLEIAPATKLEVVPWQGFSCSGQCNKICDKNVYKGPGTFRFVVTTVPVGERLVSPAFALPRQPLLR
jgi:hypothetical protein